MVGELSFSSSESFDLVLAREVTYGDGFVWIASFKPSGVQAFVAATLEPQTDTADANTVEIQLRLEDGSVIWTGSTAVATTLIRNIGKHYGRVDVYMRSSGSRGVAACYRISVLLENDRVTVDLVDFD